MWHLSVSWNASKMFRSAAYWARQKETASCHCTLKTLYKRTFQARSQNCEKRLLGFVISVCPSVRMEHLGFHWTDFHVFFEYLSIFGKYVEEIQFSPKSEKCKWYFTWRPVHVSDHISLSSSQNEKFLNKSCRDNQTHILWWKAFLRKSCRLLDNVEK